jgi:hypothetical protein
LDDELKEAFAEVQAERKFYFLRAIVTRGEKSEM